MLRKRKKYSKPKKLFDKERILEEEKIKKEFGLKNKKEIWKGDSKIKRIRQRAKSLISADQEEQQKFFEKLNKMGFKVNSIPDVLALTKEDYLKRRLQTILVKKHLAKTPREARQLIAHKKVLVGDKIVSFPSYIVPLELEDKISLKQKKQKKIKESKEEKTKEKKKEESKEEKIEENG